MRSWNVQQGDTLNSHIGVNSFYRSYFLLNSWSIELKWCKFVWGPGTYIHNSQNLHIYLHKFRILFHGLLEVYIWTRFRNAFSNTIKSVRNSVVKMFLYLLWFWILYIKFYQEILYGVLFVSIHFIINYQTYFMYYIVILLKILLSIYFVYILAILAILNINNSLLLEM